MEKSIILLENVDISLKSLLTALQLDEDDEYVDEIAKLLDEAIKLAKPVAIFKPVVPYVNNGVIELNKIIITEPFVFQMLSTNKLVFPYVASCGSEIEKWSKSFTDFFDQFVVDTLKQMCLGVVRDVLFEKVMNNFLDKDKFISSLNPGSLPEWPITGQISLFHILGTVNEDIGVTLLDSLLMSPTKSVSGIMFQTDDEYHNCQHCSRQDCPGRRTPYIEGL